MPWYNASALTLTNGTLVSGSIYTTHTQDATNLVLAETTGAPGFNFDFTFGQSGDPVPTTYLLINIHGYYSGNPGHNVKLQQYNYDTTSWTNVTTNAQDLPDQTSLQTYQFNLINNANYTSGGQIRVRFNHATAGNVNHRLYIDEMNLQSLA